MHMYTHTTCSLFEYSLCTAHHLKISSLFSFKPEKSLLIWALSPSFSEREKNSITRRKYIGSSWYCWDLNMNFIRLQGVWLLSPFLSQTRERAFSLIPYVSQRGLWRLAFCRRGHSTSFPLLVGGFFLSTTFQSLLYMVIKLPRAPVPMASHLSSATEMGQEAGYREEFLRMNE